MRALEKDAAAASHAAAPASARAVLAGLALCMLLPSLAVSSANVALPTLVEAFSATFQQVQWVVLAYLLATTTLIVSVGRLGDILGRRRLLIGGIALFTVAAAVCGTTTTLWWLIAARAAQGLGAAVMMALSMALVSEAVPKPKIGSAMGLLGTMSAVGTALGPTLGGALIASVGWQGIFFVNVPLGVVAFWLARYYLPADRRTPNADHARLDYVGSLLLALTLGAYALAMTVGRGSFGVVNLALLASAAIGVCLFAWAESRAASPLIRWATLGEPGLRASLVMTALVSTVMMATLVVGPFYLARALGLAPVQVGMAMSAGPLVAALAGVPAGRLVDRFGAQRMAAWGLAGMVVGCLALWAAPSISSVASIASAAIVYVVCIAWITAHYALFQAANNTAVMANVTPTQRGVISAVLNLSRNLGLLTGASLMGAVFALATQASHMVTAPPEAVVDGMRVTYGAAAGLIAVALVMALASLRRRPQGRSTKP